MTFRGGSCISFYCLNHIFLDSSRHSEVGVRAAGPIPREELRHHHLPLGGYHGRAEALRSAQPSAGKFFSNWCARAVTCDFPPLCVIIPRPPCAVDRTLKSHYYLTNHFCLSTVFATADLVVKPCGGAPWWGRCPTEQAHWSLHENNV